MDTQKEKLAAIAGAIREKEGTAEPIVANAFPERIREIATGLTEEEADVRYVKKVEDDVTTQVVSTDLRVNGSLESKIFHTKYLTISDETNPGIAIYRNNLGSEESFQINATNFYLDQWYYDDFEKSYAISVGAMARNEEDPDSGNPYTPVLQLSDSAWGSYGVILSGVQTPTQDYDAANKKYVDGKVSEGDGKYILKDPPTDVSHPSQKQEIKGELSLSGMLKVGGVSTSGDIVSSNGDISINISPSSEGIWFEDNRDKDHPVGPYIGPAAFYDPEDPNKRLPGLQFFDSNTSENIVLYGVDDPISEECAANKKYVDKMVQAQGWKSDPSKQVDALLLEGAPQSMVVVGSDYADKVTGDYVCDGVDDQVEIQAAIDALEANPVKGVKKTLFLVGSFNITDTIVDDQIDICGKNCSITCDKWNTGDVVEGTPPKSLLKVGDCTVQDLSMYYQINASNTDLEEVFCVLSTQGPKLSNLNITGTTWGVTGASISYGEMDNCTITSCKMGAKTKTGTIKNCTITASIKGGECIQVNEVTATGGKPRCAVIKNNLIGVRASRSCGVHVLQTAESPTSGTTTLIQDNTIYIQYPSNENQDYVGCFIEAWCVKIINNTFNPGTTNGTYKAIHFAERGKYCTVLGNQRMGKRSANMHMTFTDEGTDNVVLGNDPTIESVVPEPEVPTEPEAPVETEEGTV